ncbi:hypothetical protein ICW40_05205 [Actinotalea ferrariae]|uniref:hypothetical protein n=1 Tax=Actinotalea ferrariae TaxID=1386098 RepID=UPI001C8BC4D6|nr:hypothetical protein [Actinotalea ferrariae]MBX9244203.1 hypothetical protein [Actinotalea ferrariae]
MRPAGRRAWWRRNAVALALLVPAAGALGWVTSEDAREGWWAIENHIAVTPGPGGWASVEDTMLRLVSFERVRTMPDDYGGTWSPPAGYAAWLVVVDSRSEGDVVRLCDVTLVDTEGRSFTAPAQVPPMPVYQSGSIQCGMPNPGSEPAQPGSRGELREDVFRSEVLVVTPASAEPAEVRLSTWATDGTGFGPRYAALPVP